MDLLPDAPSTSTSQEPLYNIGVVTRMTDISMATLRAWERRYDFPEASRSLGGHRLYSEHDIMRLRWVKSRIGEGMQTAQAIQALRHQESTGHELKPITPEIPAVRNLEISHTSVSESNCQNLTDALIKRDLLKADQILGDALAVSSPEELIIQVIGPAIASIGEAWKNEKISVATEHLATNYLRQRLLMWMVSGPPAQPIPPIVLACAPEEWHEGSLLMLGALLRRQSWPIAYLGQAVPLKDLASFSRDIQPSAVILVAMTENSAKSLLDWPQWLPEAATSGKPIIGFGGRIFNLNPDWQMRMPGIFLGNSVHQGIKTINTLLNGFMTPN